MLLLQKLFPGCREGVRNSVGLAGLLAQVMVSQYEVDHGFDHGNSPWKHAGVMPAFGTEGGRFSVSGDRFLFMVDGRSGFEGCLLYTSPSPRDKRQSRMPSSA